ncbi:MAG: hypothetical protein PHE29_14990 [Tissierellia bacterium]|nr:hypothetical protein [Tissierellia bacterium]
MPEELIPERYKFDTIFNYNAIVGIIIPRYTVIINNTRYEQGIAITKNTFFDSLDLFKYIGRDIAGKWNPTSRELTMFGFY